MANQNFYKTLREFNLADGHSSISLAMFLDENVCYHPFKTSMVLPSCIFPNTLFMITWKKYQIYIYRYTDCMDILHRYMYIDCMDIPDPNYSNKYFCIQWSWLYLVKQIRGNLIFAGDKFKFFSFSCGN